MQNLSWPEIEQYLRADHHTNILMFGAPGLAKTSSAVRTSTQSPYMITCTEETSSAELRGHYIPKGNEFVWHYGPALRAWQEGRRLVINEIDRASGDALSFLYALCDDPAVARMTLPSGETLTPEAGFHVIATSNVIDLETMLPQGLFDRFTVRIMIDQLHPQQLEALSADLREVCAATVKLTDPARMVTYRQWAGFDRLRAAHGSDLAARLIFGGRAKDILNSLALAK